MCDEINQTISRFIDNDLDHDETLDLLKKMQNDEKLKAKMWRYQAISLALKTEEFIQIKPDFSRSIFQQIQQEPSYLIPQRTQPKTQTKQFYWAAAASALVAAVLAGYGAWFNQPIKNHYQAIAAVSAPQQTLAAVSSQSTTTAKQQKREPLTSQFNAYLQAHNNSVYTNGEATFHPYAKMAAYGQE